MAEIVCTVCPKGCRMNVDETNQTVTGHGCKRGVAYGVKELFNPTRVVTSTVRIEGCELECLPVKTSAPIPKHDVISAVRQLSDVVLKAPVSLGEVVLKDVLGSGADFLATRSC